jgi:hypothetical protein
VNHPELSLELRVTTICQVAKVEFSKGGVEWKDFMFLLCLAAVSSYFAHHFNVTIGSDLQLGCLCLNIQYSCMDIEAMPIFCE